MLIDWFTVGAQAFNFIVLVWLLKRFLYAPVLAAIDARDKKIGSQLSEAAATKVEAKKEQDDFQHKNEEIEKQRETLLSKATEEAKVERQKLLEIARQDSEALRVRLKQTVQREHDSLSRELVTRAQQEVFAIARKVLAELADTSLDVRMADVFIRLLQGLTEEQKAAFKVSPQGEPAVLRSASPLPQAQQAALEAALKKALGTVGLEFQVRSDLISGIELASNGHKLAWSIADYFASLEKSLEALMEAKPDPKPEAEPEVKAEAKPEVKVEPRPEVKAEAKPEVKMEPKPEVKAEAKPEVKVEPRPEVKAETANAG